MARTGQFYFIKQANACGNSMVKAVKKSDFHAHVQESKDAWMYKNDSCTYKLDHFKRGSCGPWLKYVRLKLSWLLAFSSVRHLIIMLLGCFLEEGGTKSKKREWASAFLLPSRILKRAITVSALDPGSTYKHSTYLNVCFAIQQVMFTYAAWLEQGINMKNQNVLYWNRRLLL